MGTRPPGTRPATRCAASAITRRSVHRKFSAGKHLPTGSVRPFNGNVPGGRSRRYAAIGPDIARAGRRAVEPLQARSILVVRIARTWTCRQATLARSQAHRHHATSRLHRVPRIDIAAVRRQPALSHSPGKVCRREYSRRQRASGHCTAGHADSAQPAYAGRTAARATRNDWRTANRRGWPPVGPDPDTAGIKMRED